ncbi:hypothetical protein ACB098_04G061300 [Castanea mollissima]
MINLLTNNIYDPSQCENIDTKLRDLLVENGPIRDNDLNFPIDKDHRHFSTTFYFKKLSNGEKSDRKWLVGTNQLSNEGTNDWRNISNKIKNHKASKEHVTNMNAWIDLEMRLLKNKTIDKNFQEQIKEAKYFSIILDCTPDVSNQEQMTLVLRCVEISTSPIKINKHFGEFLKVEDTSRKGLVNEIINVIKSLELDINDVRGQGYDNGSNMKGKKQGLFLFFGVVQRLYTLFSSSSKRYPKTKGEADCLATYELESFEFLLGMTIWYDILFAVNSISKNLQSKDMHIDIATKMEIEPIFCEKLDQAISSIESRFEQFQIYEDTFGFLFNFEKLKALDDKRSFSKLKLIKSYLRPTMSQERLSGLAILSIEKEMLEELKYKNLISNFASQKVRKIDFR